MHPLRLGQNRSKPKVLLPPPNPLHHINPYTTTHADGNSDEDFVKDNKKNTNTGSDDSSNDDDSDNGDSSLSDTDKAKTAKTTTPPRRKSTRTTIQAAPVETNGTLPYCKIALCTFCCCIEIALCTFNPPHLLPPSICSHPWYSRQPGYEGGSGARIAYDLQEKEKKRFAQ